ncbi:universal stress protein A-like protein isoform X3 [Tasmannia lanceolata]|uniref:universal stress protein A-like protein isoform X3 n=1 Tax=Tasmannia lanceolata TaxID=3420 RepID=UPI0040636255
MAGEEETSEKKVMLTIDESEFSLYALEWVLNNLRESISPPSHLVIYNVQPLYNLGYVYAASLAPELIQSIQVYQKKISLALLERAKEICVKAGVTPELITEVGEPKEAICEAVEKLKINLLILGSRGQGALQRVFLGSVSNYCVHNAKCPVLVVKKPM